MTDNELKMLFNSVIEEIGKVNDGMIQKFDEVNARLDSMQHEINACKLERESVSILIKKIDELEKRIATLESKIA